MPQDLNEDLRNRYPFLYEHCDLACGNGWYPILAVLSAMITKNSPDTQAGQVKEKFGELRFYAYCYNDYIDGAIDMASMVSLLTCDVCGKPGALKNNGWARTLCDSCNDTGATQSAPEPVPCTQAVGKGWARLLSPLEAELQRANPANSARLSIKKAGGKLVLGYPVPEKQGTAEPLMGDGEAVRGMLDFAMAYAEKINEFTGEPT